MKTDTSSEKYGFYDRLTPGFPSQVLVDVTEVCNLACIHCPHPTFKKSKYYAARYLEPDLNAKLVDEVRDEGHGRTQYIRYTSEGEPLIHPKGYEMIEYAVRNSGVYVTITTNGTIMNEKRTQRLLDAGVHMIDISIDAHRPETYAQIRINGDLEVTRGNVLRLLKWVREAGSRTKVVVSFVEQPQNSAERDDFKKFWEDAGADYVVIRKLHSAAGAVEENAKVIWLSLKGQARRPCVYPWERIGLNPRGFLSFCPADWTHGSTLVDFRTNTIKDTWTGPLYQALRQAHTNNDYSGHHFCGQCPDWSLTTWPGKGRAYADMVEELASG